MRVMAGREGVGRQSRGVSYRLSDRHAVYLATLGGNAQPHVHVKHPKMKPSYFFIGP